jgi:hypothetical protein
MTKKKKVILSIVAVVLAVFAYITFFGMQTLCVVWLKMFHHPMMDMVPKPLVLVPHSEPAQKLEAFGCSFSVPWAECTQKTLTTSTVWWVCAESNVYVFCDRLAAVSEAAAKDSSANPEFVEKFFGTKSVGNYAVFAKMFSLTSEDVSIFDSKSEAATETAMLRAKSVGASSHGLYGFEYEGIKGFQRGIPAVDEQADIYIFDQLDRSYRITIKTRTNSPVRLTQADINTIITTFSIEP